MCVNMKYFQSGSLILQLEPAQKLIKKHFSIPTYPRELMKFFKVGLGRRKRIKVVSGSKGEKVFSNGLIGSY